MVPERIEQPAGGHLKTQLVAVVALAVLHLPDEGLAPGHVHVGHDVPGAGQLQPPFGKVPPEVGLKGWITLKERPDIGHLVEREPVVGLFLQEPHRLHDVGQAHLEVFLAGLEDSPLPVGVRDDPEGRFFPGRGLVGGQRRREQEITEKDDHARP